MYTGLVAFALHTCHLLAAGSSDGGWALLVLDGSAAGTNRLDGPDNAVGLYIALGHATEDDVLAVEP